MAPACSLPLSWVAATVRPGRLFSMRRDEKGYARMAVAVSLLRNPKTSLPLGHSPSLRIVDPTRILDRQPPGAGVPACFATTAAEGAHRSAMYTSARPGPGAPRGNSWRPSALNWPPGPTSGTIGGYGSPPAHGLGFGKGRLRGSTGSAARGSVRVDSPCG